MTEAVLLRVFLADASGEESFVLADPAHRVAALNLLRELLDFCVPVRTTTVYNTLYCTVGRSSG